MFSTVLIANRGEIAVRVIRTLRALGIRSVAVYSDADVGARHVRDADVAVRLGPAPARESYLSIERILAAAAETGAEAIHPGYGFLAENAEFARACAAADVVFIGPPPTAVEVMGDKIRAKQTVSAAGVPVVPGRTEPGMTDADLVESAAEIGYPVLIKPSAGGGGKGMRLVTDPGDLAKEIASARREAASSFGDDTLFLERFVTRPRHIEVQVLADTFGHAISLGERECSLQRRHQKIVEEAPSPLLDDATRERICAAAVDTAKAVDYTGAGTVEFIVGADRPDEFFFMEMNTRLQVEHPVTELVTGVDLVEQQVRIAAGERLDLQQADVTLTGHAVEARIYAEDPARGFLPTGGTVLALAEPTGPGVRVDSGLLEGAPVGTTYDPMLAKVIAWGPDRASALSRLDTALADQLLLGVPTNVAFLRALLRHPDVAAGELDTELVERHLADLVAPVPTDRALAAYALLGLADLGGPDPWDAPTAWRPAGPGWLVWRLHVDGADHVQVAVQGPPHAAQVRIGEGDPVPASVDGDAVTIAGRTGRWSRAVAGDTVWLHGEGRTWRLVEEQLRVRADSADAHAGDVRSPMPGTVIAVQVAPGEVVAAGQALVIVEAMKMEHTLSAPHDGTIAELSVSVGAQVAVDQLLAVVASPAAADAAPEEPA